MRSFQNILPVGFVATGLVLVGAQYYAGNASSLPFLIGSLLLCVIGQAVFSFYTGRGRADSEETGVSKNKAAGSAQIKSSAPLAVWPGKATYTGWRRAVC